MVLIPWDKCKFLYASQADWLYLWTLGTEPWVLTDSQVCKFMAQLWHNHGAEWICFLQSGPLGFAPRVLIQTHASISLWHHYGTIISTPIWATRICSMSSYRLIDLYFYGTVMAQLWNRVDLLHSDLDHLDLLHESLQTVSLWHNYLCFCMFVCLWHNYLFENVTGTRNAKKSPRC